MAHSNETAHLGLSIFAGEDRPSIMNDVNADHVKIDKFAAETVADFTTQKMLNAGMAATINELNQMVINLENEVSVLKARATNDEVQISQNATAIANIQKQLTDKDKE